jgi:hypothetical protein
MIRTILSVPQDVSRGTTPKTHQEIRTLREAAIYLNGIQD